MRGGDPARLSRLLGLVVAGCAASIPASVRAAEVYVVRVAAETPLFAGSCARVGWGDDLLFHNPTTQDAAIRLLGLSNGSPPETPLSLVVPAGKTTTARSRVNWSPTSTVPVPLWVNRLDVPEGLVVQSRVYAATVLCGGLPPPTFPNLGSFPMPVFRTLAAPNAKQVHLGADLIYQESRVNVGIYNAGLVPATATTELRQGCNDDLLETRMITIPANTLVQIGGLGAETRGCPVAGGGTQFWVRYVTVSVDQPSFSYVVNRVDELRDDLRPLKLFPRIPFVALFSSN